MIKYWYVNTNLVNSFMAVFSNWFPFGIMRCVQNADSTYSWSIKQKLHSIFIFHFLSIFLNRKFWLIDTRCIIHTYIHEWWEKIHLHTKLNWIELNKTIQQSQYGWTGTVNNHYNSDNHKMFLGRYRERERERTVRFQCTVLSWWAVTKCEY